MSSAPQYPKRLIEVDLPIKRISAHARREKSIRHGHISTLHIWWARRPLAACRAVLCASLWPDPVDELCPQAFRDAAARALHGFAKSVAKHTAVANLTEDDFLCWMNLTKPAGKLDPANEAHWPVMQDLLFRFIAEFAAWEASVEPTFLETARELTQAAHEALGGAPGTHPLVVDPFAGGGSIPLEALRIGADAFASDLNPVAVLLNKVVLEYIPKYGNAEIRMHNAAGEEVVFEGLAEAVRYWGTWIKEQAADELAEFYPTDPEGTTPIAYLWARTVSCEGPGCGADVPLIRSLWLSNRGSDAVALRIVPTPREKRVKFEIIEKARPRDVGEGTIRGGSATCPLCGFTMQPEALRSQLVARRGGAADAQLVCVIGIVPGQRGRVYRLPNSVDTAAAAAADHELRRRAAHIYRDGPALPNEELNHLRGFFNVVLYGMTRWGDLFAPRQALFLVTMLELLKRFRALHSTDKPDEVDAVVTCLALALDGCADHNAALCAWRPGTLDVGHVFGRQALPMTWDFAEVVPIAESTGSLRSTIDRIGRVLVRESVNQSVGSRAMVSDATSHPLPDDAAEAVITDPPYYAAIPYADLSDFFYVWLRRSLLDVHPGIFATSLTPKDAECVSLAHRAAMYREKDAAWFEDAMARACDEARRVTKPSGVGVFVFANKETAGWEAMLNAMIASGWVVTASWPVDTEMGTRLRAIASAVLGSSVHLVCRPRENEDGSVHGAVGDWRDVLAELPGRIHDWMPRLAREGVVGADAIFACLGPALEVFSRYSRVEKASGEEVTLGEYLEHVWATVAREALNMVFSGADATGFEDDARITAMWLWTLSTGANGSGKSGESADDADADDSEDEAEGDGTGRKSGSTSGYALEYDAARKIAQGLGAHLERLGHLVEVKGGKARLLPVSERTQYLFGKAAGGSPKPKKKQAQRSLFAELEELGSTEPDWGELRASGGKTVLDHIHQSMILFAAGRGEALKRFLVDEGYGREERFWRLAQALSALYPAHTEEKRWVDGVLARKKGLGL